MTAAELIEKARSERNAGNLTAAADSYKRAADAFHLDGQPLREAHAIRHSGDILQDAGELTTAQPCYEEALAIYRPHPDTPPLDLANAIAGYARLSEKLNHRQRATLLWNQAFDLYTQCSVQAGIDEARSRLDDLAKHA